MYGRYIHVDMYVCMSVILNTAKPLRNEAELASEAITDHRLHKREEMIMISDLFCRGL